MAITFGLLDDQTANRVMDRLLAKLKEVGYTNFTIGLTGKAEGMDMRVSWWTATTLCWPYWTT